MREKPKICVVGSSNYDLIAYTDQLPKEGETIRGNHFKMGCGGKGANQAVTAAKLGAKVFLITKLGQDIFGKEMLENFKNLKINTKFIYFTDRSPSGVAPIWVDKYGNNSIIMIPGANDLISLNELKSSRRAMMSSQILICQNEIPLHITKKALQMAKEAKITTLFNPAPVCKLSDYFFKFIDILCLNEIEANLLTKHSVKSIEDACKAGKILLSKGVKKVLITLGARGCVLITEDLCEHIKTLNVKVCDTTGAGDCFIGSFAYFYSFGLTDREAAYRANYVAALSVQKNGTQSSFPNAKELPKKLFNIENMNLDICAI